MLQLLREPDFRLGLDFAARPSCLPSLWGRKIGTHRRGMKPKLVHRLAYAGHCWNAHSNFTNDISWNWNAWRIPKKNRGLIRFEVFTMLALRASACFVIRQCFCIVEIVDGWALFSGLTFRPPPTFRNLKVVQDFIFVTHPTKRLLSLLDIALDTKRKTRAYEN